MAGIGFELKKLFSENNSTFDDIKAITYSALISVGPWLLTTISLNILILVGKEFILSRSERNLFMTTIVYCFIFSQILIGAFQYIVTRYISDCIYLGEQKKLRSTYIGSINFVVILSFLSGILFFKDIEIAGYFKYTILFLFCILCALWMSMNYISLIKNYFFMILSYVLGNVFSILFGFIVLKFLKNQFFHENMAYTMVLSYAVGVAFTFFMQFSYLTSVFSKDKESNYEFLKAFKRYSSLSLIGIFFSLGMWSHIFINWFYGESYYIGGIFLASPLYEVAVFYAFFITIPTMVYFLVFMETEFFPVYKKYYALLSLKGNLEEIEVERKNMLGVIKEEIYYIMELQFFISFSMALLTKTIFSYFQLDLYLMDLFRIMVFGAYCTVFVSLFIIIFLYFDSRKEALIVSGTFLVLVSFFSVISGILGEEYSGLGFFVGSFLTLILCEIILDKIGNNLNYITFYKQNFMFEIESGFLNRVEHLMNKKIYIPILIIIMLFLGGCNRYNKQGFNISTGRNRNTMSYFDKSGYDMEGYNFEGIDKKGFNREGWNTYTNSPYDYFNFNVRGKNKETGGDFDSRGFDYQGINEKTGKKYDEKGFDYQGINEKTGTYYNEKGFDLYGTNEKTETEYDESGYTEDGYNKRGFNKKGWNKETKSKYDIFDFTFNGKNRETNTNLDKRGFDYQGINEKTGRKYDKEGFDYQGINEKTGTYYNEKGFDLYGTNEKTGTEYDESGYTEGGYNKAGYNRKGFNQEGIDKDGFNKEGVYIGDEN